MAENTEVKKEDNLNANPGTGVAPMPEQQQMVQQTSVAIPQNEQERLNFFQMLMKLLEKIRDIVGTKAAYTKKDIQEIKKATQNIQRALEGGDYSNSELAQLGSMLYATKNAIESDKPFEAKECVSMAEGLVLDKQIGKMLDGSNELKLIKNDLGIDLVFCPAAGKDEMGLIALKDGKVQSWYKDIEQLKQDLENPDIVLSEENFLDTKTEDIREIAVSAWENKREEIRQVSEERLFQTELNSVAPPEYMQEVADMIQNSELFDKDNMNLVINTNTSTILIEDNYKDTNPERLLLVLADTGKDSYGISSIRMVDENFDGKDFDKETMLKESSALIYTGKVSMIDHDSGEWTFGDAFVMNTALDGVALGIGQELAKNMDMEIVDAVKEQIQDIKDNIEEARVEEQAKEQVDLQF